MIPPELQKALDEFVKTEGLKVEGYLSVEVELTRFGVNEEPELMWGVYGYVGGTSRLGRGATIEEALQSFRNDN